MSLSTASSDHADATRNVTKDDIARAERAARDLIPPYISKDSWQPWDASAPCPAGFTCTVLGNATLGAFSCDEMARVALEVFGFGDVLAGTHCPEGEMGVMNCDRGGYCPDSATRMECPAGWFCPYKTSAPNITGGGVPCPLCKAGAKDKHESRNQLIVAWLLFALLCTFVIVKILRRKAGINHEMLKRKLHLDSISVTHSSSSKTEVKRGQEKYVRLRGKLELIATRLDKLREEGGGQRASSRTSLDQRSRSVLYMSKKGSIIFDANEFYDVLDTDDDGKLSFADINKVLCLGDEQLQAVVTSMRARMPADYVPEERDTVARATFVGNFLDVLADAYQLAPTAEEAGELFDRLLEEVGSAESGEVPYTQLFNSCLATFLDEVQIYAIIRRFRQQKMAAIPPGTSPQKVHPSGLSVVAKKNQGVSKDDFVKHYPLFLSEVSRPGFDHFDQGDHVTVHSGGGLDVAFKNLCLAVNVGGKQVNVVDDVTGRLRLSTMTAVMGGSGSGKSSLLNALCGRAWYGNVTGTIKINGNDSLIEEHKAVIGFVPQDDIVFPDLTVRENLLYSGRLLLPSGTSEEEISELADTTMASLGLSRIANSLVGDATRRGVSGGEKKRVNIGLELMKKPKILFLDEPTSGLDSRSAFVVMDSLKRLVKTQGMTVASVIHQPRTDIYDMFDSLFLLGVGGRTVYHGPATEARSYFESLGFQMQHGESQADWFLDISSGDVEPVPDIEAGGTGEQPKESAVEADKQAQDDGPLAKARATRERLFEQFLEYFESLSLDRKAAIYDPPEAFALPDTPKAVSSWWQFVVQFRRNSLLSWRNRDSRIIDFSILIIAVLLMTLLGGSKISNWQSDPKAMPWFQFVASAEDASHMLNPFVFRYALMGVNSIINYGLMIGIIMCVLMGLNSTKIITDKRLEFFREAQSGANTTAYYIAASTTATLEQGFSAFVGSVVTFLVLNPTASYLVYLWNFFMLSWLSVSWALLLSIVAPKDSVMTAVGFFNAFFGLLFCGRVAPGTFKNIYLNSNPAVGTFLALFSGFAGPLRFFVEGIAVSEARCLPQQSGYTVPDSAFNYPKFQGSYPYNTTEAMARTDPATVAIQSCSGWFWWVPASIAVGMTVRIAGGVAIHFSSRPQQGKKSFRNELVDDFKKCRAGTKPIFQSFILTSIIVFLIFAGFFALSTWLILRENAEQFSRFVKPSNLLENGFGMSGVSVLEA